MKRATVSLLLTAAALAVQPLTRGERDLVLSHLHATRKLFLDAIIGLSPAQWKFKPAPDRWSIAECAEHVALSEDFMVARVQQLLKSPAATDRKSAVKDPELMKNWLDRAQKAQAGAETQPKGRWPSPARLAEAFKQRRDRTLDYARETQDPLRTRFSSAAPDAWDAYQWLLSIAGHTERHILQINEVKADPRFPK